MHNSRLLHTRQPHKKFPVSFFNLINGFSDFPVFSVKPHSPLLQPLAWTEAAVYAGNQILFAGLLKEVQVMQEGRGYRISLSCLLRETTLSYLPYPQAPVPLLPDKSWNCPEMTCFSSGSPAVP